MIIWCVIIAIFCIKDKKIRSSIKDLIKSIRKILIKIPGIVMIIYIAAFGALLYKLGYLKSTIIKDYIWWVLFGLLPVIFRVIENYKTITVKHIIKDIIKFSIIPLFIINSYTMSLIGELLIIPLAVICSGCLVMCDYKDVSPYVKKVFNGGLIIISMVMIYYGFKGFIANIDDIKDIVFWKSISIDIVCISGSIPLIFYFRWYLLYEQVGLYIGIRSKLNKWIIYLVTFKNCLLKREKLVLILDNINDFYRIENWRDLDYRIKDILSGKYEETEQCK
ncbi:hypothetical protein PN398_09980 [Romboutsia sp. 1001216sp1]|uniref:hypothetical protein n=2 Tax=Romboutsia TaxID=1501226 RepID=UPI00232F53D1|nr:hypothetical protein [Romboutsia sp. 1001216sp1]MDB8791055.1 hypothetical protein [Romboutsia sp. 1001216sp1]